MKITAKFCCHLYCITWHSLCHVHTELQILTLRYYDDWYERKAAPSSEPCRRFAWPSAWPRHRHGSLEHWRWAAVCCGPRAWPCLLSVAGIYFANKWQKWGKILSRLAENNHKSYVCSFRTLFGHIVLSFYIISPHIYAFMKWHILCKIKIFCVFYFQHN